MMKGRRTAIILSAVSVVVLAFLSLFSARGVYARNRGEDKPIIGALFVCMDINIKCSDGNVCAVAHNRLTVFTGIVAVKVTLYYSASAPDADIKNMTVAAVNSTDDLDFSKSLSVSCPINGEEYYWEAEVKWTVDGGAEKTMRTDVICYGSDGSMLQYDAPCTW